jgi:hypothetical protein
MTTGVGQRCTAASTAAASRATECGRCAEWLGSEHIGGPTAPQQAAAAHARLARPRQDLRSDDPGGRLMFDDRLYERGGLAVHALRRTMGEGAFFWMPKGWPVIHRHGVATTASLVAYAQQYTAQPAGCPLRHQAAQDSAAECLTGRQFGLRTVRSRGRRGAGRPR